MPNTRELAQIIDRETGDVNNLRDKKLADATAQQQSGSASTDSVVMKTTGGEYVEIARDSFVGAIKGVMDGLIKGNSYTTLGANDPIAAFNSNALGGITPANLASVLGVLDVPIVFESTAEAVKAKCVESFGGLTGGSTGVPGFRGEITYRQASAVGEIPAQWLYNSKIGGTFNELRFFRNMWRLGNSCFRASGLTSIIAPEGVSTIIAGAFGGLTGYVELPSTTLTIGNYTFGYNANCTVKLYATTPPTIDYSKNDGVNKFMVPQSALSTYQADAQWSQYGSKLEGF